MACRGSNRNYHVSQSTTKRPLSSELLQVKRNECHLFSSKQQHISQRTFSVALSDAHALHVSDRHARIRRENKTKYNAVYIPSLRSNAAPFKCWPRVPLQARWVVFGHRCSTCSQGEEHTSNAMFFCFVRRACVKRNGKGHSYTALKWLEVEFSPANGTDTRNRSSDAHAKSSGLPSSIERRTKKCMTSRANRWKRRPTQPHILLTFMW